MSFAANSDARFSSTRWSVVLHAARGDAPGAQAATEQLFCRYWYPVYAFLRRHGQSPHDAEDLTQDFFARLLSRQWLAGVEPGKGLFRTFLLACLRNHLSHARVRANGPTRHPGRPILSIDARSAEERYALEPADVRDPASLFDRRWAYALIEETLQRLREHYAAESKAALFDELRGHLIGDAERGDYAEAAARLGMSEGAVRVAASRLREHFRERLRAGVGRTVDDPRDVDEEIRRLFTSAR
jgi:RNA polymerase sigma-70 factor (ECF subfamily)